MTKAREIMTAAVISVAADTPTREVAKLLRDNGISAVPVLDQGGAAIGMVSEGDLIGRGEKERETRRDWWLTLLAEGEALHPEFLATLRGNEHAVREVMATPVITVGEETEIGDIAKLLTAHRIKRVPVTHDGRVVGIVSRADLVRSLAAEEAQKPASASDGGIFAEALAGIDNQFHHLQRHTRPSRSATDAKPGGPDNSSLTVADFRALVADHDHKQAEQEQERRHALDEERRRRVAELIDQHISDESWRSLLHSARQAAEQGEKEFMLLRFPSQLCTDGGRAINSALPEWSDTLRGEAAELYLRWERDLKPSGFPLTARLLDFPGGMPGDIGLFLIWGE